MILSTSLASGITSWRKTNITALVVAKNVRGLVIGGSLVRHVEALAAARGVNGVVVTTANHREATLRFYERLSYEWTGRRYGRRRGTTNGR